MSRKPAVHFAALVLAAFGLTACGGDEEGDDESAPSPTPSATSEEPASEEPTTEESAEAPESTEEVSVEPSTSTGGGTEDPGPAPKGAVIPTDALSSPPPQVGEFTLQGGSGPAHLYSHSQESIVISVGSDELSSPYETFAAQIKKSNVPAGTGSCGTNEGGTSITCYLRTEGGVINIGGSPLEISVAELAVFANQFAAAAGAA